METNQKNSQHGQGTKTDSKQNNNQYQGTQKNDRNQSQDYSKNSPESDDVLAKHAAGNRSKNTNGLNDDDITAEGPNTRKEYDDTGHKHDYKTPLDTNLKNTDHNKNEIKNGMNQKAGMNNQNAKNNGK